jgi:hypothetical protein
MPLGPTELIFNIDECGFSDWEERKRKPVLIPSSAQGIALRYPVNRSYGIRLFSAALRRLGMRTVLCW